MKKILFGFVLLCSMNVSAQWIEDTDVNTEVVVPTAVDLIAVGGSEGQTYALYYKSVGAPQNLQLRLQIINPDGTQKFGAEGKVVSDSIPMGTASVTTKAVLDDEDNIYIGVTGTDGNKGYLFAMDKEGNHLFDPNGIVLGEGIGYVVTPAPLSNGNVAVAWNNNGKCELQLFGSDGTALWEKTDTVTQGTLLTTPDNIHELENGDIVILFHSFFRGLSSTLYAQRYSQDGEVIWEEPLKVSDLTFQWNRLYESIVYDDKIFVGYSADNANNLRESFLQVIDAENGTLLAGNNGIPFDADSLYREDLMKITLDNATGNIWAVSSYTGTNQQNDKGIYVQKFSTETLESVFPDGPKKLYGVSPDYFIVPQGDIHDADGDLLFLVGVSNENNMNLLKVIRIDENGEFEFPEESIDVATTTHIKSKVNLLRPASGGAVAIWSESRTVDKNQIFAQKITEGFETDIPSVQHVRNITTFPNPTSTVLDISFDSEVSSEGMLEIYNVEGKVIAQRDVIILGGSNHISLDVSSFSPGTYILKIKGENIIATEKFVKQ